MLRLFFICLFVYPSSIFASDPLAYRFFDDDGNAVRFQDVADAAAEADIVLFGELHNNPVVHWLRQELLSELLQAGGRNLVVGGEMFERHDQLILDEYLSGMVAENNFENEARLWNNYHTDYKPMIAWVKENNIPFIATNIPRRYASMVARNDLSVLDTLSDKALENIAPLPVEVDTDLRSYRKMLDMAGHHGTESMIQAQAIKDATMAHFILENVDPETSRFFHVNGAYHNMYNEGIVWYIRQQQPELRILTIHAAEQSQTEKLYEENLEKSDYILVIPNNMIKTH